jgi:hypothetical protein
MARDAVLRPCLDPPVIRRVHARQRRRKHTVRKVPFRVSSRSWRLAMSRPRRSLAPYTMLAPTPARLRSAAYAECRGSPLALTLSGR